MGLNDSKWRNFVVWLFNLAFAEWFPASISTLFQRCLLFDMTSRCGTTSNQRWNNVVYLNVRIYNVEQRLINVAYFSVDVNDVRQRQNNVVLFNVVKMTISKKNKKTNHFNLIQSSKFKFKVLTAVS